MTIRRWTTITATALALAGSLAAWAAYPPQARIAYVVDAPGGTTSRIYLADPDGKNPRPLTSGTGRDRAPAFSPDGQWLAFQSTNDIGLDLINVQPVDGSAPARQLALGSSPSWSADGKRILFSRRYINEQQLYAIRSDFKQRDGLLKPVAKGIIGRWSPDGKRLAAVAGVIVEGKDAWQLQIRPMSEDGKSALDPTATLTLPEDLGQVVSLEWSPDGTQLLLSTVRQSSYALAVVEADKPALKRVPTGNPLPNPAYGSWSPDGKEIVFRAGTEAEMSASQRLYVMKADGTEPKVLLEPKDPSRLQGAAWLRPPVQVVAVPTPVPPVVKPAPMPKPPVEVKPAPMPKPPVRALGAPQKRRDAGVVSFDRSKSPVSADLGAPGDADFIVSVQALPIRGWKERRQGVGVSLELADGSLYRGTVIHSNGPWVTLQGRPKDGRVRLIDGKKIEQAGTGFTQGFKLSIRREGKNLIILVNDEELLTRPLLTSPVKSLLLTLENFDPGAAKFNLGAVYYREWGMEAAE